MYELELALKKAWVDEVAQTIFEEVRPLLNAEQDKQIREILYRMAIRGGV